MLFTGINVNRKWKPDATWFGEYASAYVQSSSWFSNAQASHDAARAFADTGRFSTRFSSI
jgi:hypothetical protein